MLFIIAGVVNGIATSLTQVVGVNAALKVVGFCPAFAVYQYEFESFLLEHTQTVKASVSDRVECR